MDERTETSTYSDITVFGDSTGTTRLESVNLIPVEVITSEISSLATVVESVHSTPDHVVTSKDFTLSTLLESLSVTYNNHATSEDSSWATLLESLNSTAIAVVASEDSTLLDYVNSTTADVNIPGGPTLLTLLESVTSQDSNISSTSECPVVLSILLAVFLFITFIIGILGNSFYLWILVCKMKPTVSTIWFQHLISAYLLFTLVIPFYAIFLVMDCQWIFGTTLCKLVTFVVSLSMFASVFLLTVISVDRCVLVVNPLWTKSYRTFKSASVVCFSVWILALLFSLPYLAFPKTYVAANNKITCFNDYVLSDDWITIEIQHLRRRVHLSMFILRLVMGFLLPLSVMTACYLKLAVTLKAGNHNKTNKPFRVIATAVTSFFVCWLPYHIYSGLIVYEESVSQLLVLVVMFLTIVLCCINAGCTPIMYLFIGETFRDLSKSSIHSLFSKAFAEVTLHNVLEIERTSHQLPTSDKSRVTKLSQLESSA
ncbi:probable G-protein coupled receptor 33 [Pleurodeles waltl]|uniref:probable G-protein coupled receptor 33 n=1 Tax=Pleurodeles waltl TaxID=8319 RepID=UPI00370974C1